MDTSFNPALMQLTQRLHEANLGGGAVDPNVLLGKPGDLLSSAEATTQYSSSESSSAADNLNCQIDSNSVLDTYSGATAARQTDGARQSSSQEGKAQICFDFTKGVCSRGEKCKYSHDLATIVHFNSKEKGICFDYLRNQCHRGLLCRFSHDLSNIAQQCQVYNNGTKENKGTKPNAICYDFVKGVCQRGAECRYSHDLSLIARMARGGSAQPKAGEVCYDYLRGRCNRGATCKYSHNIAFLAAPGFLGNTMSSDGAPIAAQAPGAGLAGSTAPLAGIPMANGPGFVGMGGLPGMAPRLSQSLSADHAAFNHVLAAAGPGAVNQMLAAQAAMQQNGFAAAAAAEAAAAAVGGRRRSASMTGDNANDTLLVNDQPSGPWPGMPGAPKAMSVAQQAAMMTNLAAQQRMAAAAANMQAFGHMAQLPGLGAHGPASSGGGPSGNETMIGQGAPGVAPGIYGKPMGMNQFCSGPDAGMRRPPLPPGQVPPEFAALLSGNVENQSIFAETLAAAAKAQAQNQSARMMAAAAAVNGSNGQSGNNMLPSLGSSGSVPPVTSAGAAVPQPIPGRDGVNYEVNPNGPYAATGTAFPVAGTSQSGGGAAVENAHLSRSAPTNGPVGPHNQVNVSPDLLPMIKEIWSKPGAA